MNCCRRTAWAHPAGCPARVADLQAPLQARKPAPEQDNLHAAALASGTAAPRAESAIGSDSITGDQARLLTFRYRRQGRTRSRRQTVIHVPLRISSRLYLY